MPAEDAATLENLNTAYEFYKLIQSDSWVDEIFYKSKLYAVQNNILQTLQIMSSDTYRCTKAMLLHSGYHSVLKRRMLWETKADCNNGLVADTIRRKEVDVVLSCLHFRDNTKIIPWGDSFYKVQPIYDNLNRAGKRWFTGGRTYSVDKVMVPYYGRHSSKQADKVRLQGVVHLH
jgi:hypothetical protein